jgi:outer membrane immunogenic protein
MRKWVFGLAALIAATTASVAADMTVDIPAPVIPPAVPAGHDWSGWYAGGYAGALGGRFTHDLDEPGLSGLDAGVQVHYNWVGGNLVLSPYLAATLPIQKSELLVLNPGTFVNVQWAAQAGLRLGFVHDRFLPYVYAGGVIGAAHADFGSGETHTHTGYTLGAGLEYAVDNRWTVGVRYAFYSLGPEEYFSAVNAGWKGHSILGTISFKIH